MENRNSVNQRRDAIRQFIDTHRAALVRRGSLMATWRGPAERRSGPYYLLIVRDAAGQRRSVYLGREGPLVAEARAELVALQAPQRERRVFSCVQRQLRRGLQGARRDLDRQLAPLGLRRQGREVRGWRRRFFSGDRKPSSDFHPSLPSNDARLT